MTLGSTHAYGEPLYWDKRYGQESGPFDWYQKYPALAPLLDLYLSRHHRILVVGCGNSALSVDMADDGYEDLVNIDISSVVIDAMQRKYSDRPQLKYTQMDVRDMSPLETGLFDSVIDKGTLDSLLCGQNSQQNAARMLQEVGRVLKDRGVYILITYGAPIYRLNLLKDSCSWTVKLHVIGWFKFLLPNTLNPLPFPQKKKKRGLLHQSLAVNKSLTSISVLERKMEMTRPSNFISLWRVRQNVNIVQFDERAEKNVLEEGPNHQKWALINPIPLDDDGSSAEVTFGKNPDVHFIYVCTKDSSEGWANTDMIYN
ncbi:Methyltransferase type 11 [Dillenia turbinata]|uniref:Methyltransferase type 11 n=1 Tax=Dillenia turbinata TaxID=194707 RepID=A0AAN8YSF8_9MAGN